ncbi:phage tail protein, partial [Enterobacter ludwigii]|uniref:phage tail-collar fiber domain-containing protein n=1 Tax=Enterobacter ludwigii TaxID=299767 RepID=UPI000AFBA45C
MSQTVITAAFESWKAQEAAGGNRVVLDGFVLAYVPGLDPDAPVSNTEGLPPDSQIVYRQDVDKCGVVNNNSVVYSITMGSNVGTFDFNWIGLVNKASGVLAMIVHTPVQRKLKTEDGQQGNAINRSFLMEYDGAATETEINTPAQTWQIDFTARLSGMDEEWRLANFDIYGPGAFFGDGFLVKKDGSQYQVQAGTGYIGGVRSTLSASEEIPASTLPAKVFADVSWQGALTGRWQSVTTVQASTTDLSDYIDGDGFAHYVFAVASIDAGGAVTDLRPIGSIPAQVADGAIKTITAGNNTHKPGATGDVKLGSAADADIVTSMTDTTAGRVPVVGWMGTGGPEIPIPDGTDIYKYFA